MMNRGEALFRDAVWLLDLWLPAFVRLNLRAAADAVGKCWDREMLCEILARFGRLARKRRIDVGNGREEARTNRALWGKQPSHGDSKK